MPKFAVVKVDIRHPERSFQVLVDPSIDPQFANITEATEDNVFKLIALGYHKATRNWIQSTYWRSISESVKVNPALGQIEVLFAHEIFTVMKVG